MGESGDSTRAQAIARVAQENEKHELSQDEAYQLLWASFKFSQGSLLAQDQLLKLYHLYNPEVVFESDAQIQKHIAQKISDGVVRMMSQGRHVYLHDNGARSTAGGHEFGVDRQTIVVQAAGWTDDLPLYLSSETSEKNQPTDSKETLLGQILEHFIQKDMSYIRYDGGRPQTHEPFRSYVISNIILGEPCGSPHFQPIFDDLAGVLKQKMSREPLFREALKRLHMYWSSHQPPESRQSFVFVEDEFLHRGTITE